MTIPRNLSLFAQGTFASGGVSIGNTTDPGASNLSVTGSSTSASFIPSSSTVPTNGVFLPAANQVGFSTATSEAMRIDSSGNVGIGTGIAGAYSPSLRLGNSGSGGGVVTATLSLGSYSTGYGSNLISSSDFSSSSASYLAFGTTPSGASGLSAPVERMRIDSSGNVGIGISSPLSYTNYVSLQINGTTGGVLSLRNTANTANFEMATNTTETYIKNVTATPITFATNNIERMRISVSGGVSIGNTTDAGATNLSVTGKINTAGIKTGSGYLTNNFSAPEVMFSAAGAGIYNVFAYIDSYDPTYWAAQAIVTSSGAGILKLVANNNTGMQITVSGNNVLCQQIGGGSAIGTYYIYERII